MGKAQPPALLRYAIPYDHHMQTLLLILEAFLCPWPRPVFAGCPDSNLLTETNEKKPSLALFSFGGKKTSTPAQAPAQAWTPPPVPQAAPLPAPTPIPPPATTSASDAAMQQQDLARQNKQRRGFSRTLLAGESYQPVNTDTGRRTLLG